MQEQEPTERQPNRRLLSWKRMELNQSSPSYLKERMLEGGRQRPLR